MKRAVLLLGLFMSIVVASSAQTALPNIILDSMIFEVKRGRQCEVALTASQEEIQALGKENVHLGTALKLSQSESSTLSNLLENAKKGNEILSSQFALDLSKEKKKTKRWRKVSIVEGIGLIGLLILML